MTDLTLMSKVPLTIITAMKILENNNFQAFLVGGCVRDLILKRVPYDFDITTNALPKEILETFKNYKTIETGISHGTVSVIIENYTIEITTFRHESDYLDYRHPSKVEFLKTIDLDLSRRDFTINALAINLNGNIIDLFNGENDIQNQVIRCINNPNERFNEDALRILRALRFSSQLNFSIDKKTEIAIRKNKELIKKISIERITSELIKTIDGVNCFEILKNFQDVINVFIPEITTSNLIKWDNNDSLVIKLALFFFNIDNRDNIKTILTRLKYSNNIISIITMIFNNYNTHLNSKTDIKLLLSKIGLEKTLILLDFMKYTKNINNIRNSIKKIVENNECYTISQLNINGSDIKKLGISGKYIGIALNHLLYQVISEKIKNEKSVLIEYLDNKTVDDFK